MVEWRWFCFEKLYCAVGVGFGSASTPPCAHSATMRPRAELLLALLLAFSWPADAAFSVQKRAAALEQVSRRPVQGCPLTPPPQLPAHSNYPARRCITARMRSLLLWYGDGRLSPLLLLHRSKGAGQIAYPPRNAALMSATPTPALQRMDGSRT